MGDHQLRQLLRNRGKGSRPGASADLNLSEKGAVEGGPESHHAGTEGRRVPRRTQLCMERSRLHLGEEWQVGGHMTVQP